MNWHCGADPCSFFIQFNYISLDQSILFHFVHAILFHKGKIAYQKEKKMLHEMSTFLQMYGTGIIVSDCKYDRRSINKLNKTHKTNVHNRKGYKWVSYES